MSNPGRTDEQRALCAQIAHNLDENRLCSEADALELMRCPTDDTLTVTLDPRWPELGLLSPVQAVTVGLDLASDAADYGYRFGTRPGGGGTYYEWRDGRFTVFFIRRPGS